MTPMILNAMIDYFAPDVRRINHAVKVFGFARAIASGLRLDDRTNSIIEYASLLHDIGIINAEKKHGSAAGNYQEIEGPPIASGILSSLKINDDIIDRVCQIIGHHHTYAAIDGIDFQVLVESDCIVNIFEDGLSRTAIDAIEKNVFKTAGGRDLLKRLYPR